MSRQAMIDAAWQIAEAPHSEALATWTHSGACHGETVQVTTSHALLDIFTTWRLLRGLDSDTATSESREIGGAGDAV